MAIKLAKIKLFMGSLLFLKSGETVLDTIRLETASPVMPVVAKIRIRLESGLEPARLVSVLLILGKSLFWA